MVQAVRAQASKKNLARRIKPVSSRWWCKAVPFDRTTPAAGRMARRSRRLSFLGDMIGSRGSRPSGGRWRPESVQRRSSGARPPRGGRSRGWRGRPVIAAAGRMRHSRTGTSFAAILTTCWTSAASSRAWLCAARCWRNALSARRRHPPSRRARALRPPRRCDPRQRRSVRRQRRCPGRRSRPRARVRSPVRRRHRSSGPRRCRPSDPSAGFLWPGPHRCRARRRATRRPPPGDRSPIPARRWSNPARHRSRATPPRCGSRSRTPPRSRRGTRRREPVRDR